MLGPKRIKYRKRQKGKCGTVSSRQRDLVWRFRPAGNRMRMADQPSNRGGSYCTHSSREAWWSGLIRVFPDKPLSKKPAETRMGKGKGNPETWVAVVKLGRVIYELEGVPEDVAREAFRLCGHKLPISTKFLTRREVL